jgi:tetratricopeptide (TPR) repeat protein
MSAIYLAAKEPALAARYLRPAIQIFEEIGDEHGVDLAQRNLASALTADGTSDAEADELIRTIAERSGENDDGRRQMAWLANILTRKYRTAGRLDDALETAREAITLAEELGDENLRALNLVNLGNVYRDRDEAGGALQAYRDAGVAAQACGRRDIEADASRLIAGILNDFESVPDSANRFEQARDHATHAVGLLRESVSYEGLARAYVELGDAEENLGNKSAAASAYFDAARYFEKVPDTVCYERAILRGASLAIGDNNTLYLERMEDLLAHEVERSENDRRGERFLELLPSILRRAPRGSLARLLTLHLRELWLHLEPGSVGAVTDFVLESARTFSLSCPTDQSFRVLYAGVVMAALLRNRASPFHQSQLAGIVRSINGIYVREDADGSRDWTVVLDLTAPVTVSIIPLDASPASNVACLALAMFMKGFEKELQRELFGDASVVQEVTFMVGSLDQMPADIAERMQDDFGIDGILADQACIVTRSTDPGTATPTFVVLRPDFLEQMDLIEGDNASLPVLFGLSLSELTFQLLREEVSSEELTPKITKLVRQALG